MKALGMAAASLWRSPRRTVLTVAGLANAVVGGLTFYGFTHDTYWGLAESFARSGNGHIQVADAAWFEAPAPEQHRVDRARLEALRAALAADPTVGPLLAGSTVRRAVMGMLVAGGRSGVFLGQGTEPAAEPVLAPLAHPSAGRALDAAEPEGVLLGVPLAARLGVGPGDTVTAMVTTDDGLTNAMDLTVRGTVKTGAIELDRTYMSLPVDTAFTLAGAPSPVGPASAGAAGPGQPADLLVLALTDTDQTDRALVAVQAVLDRPAFAGLAARPWYARADYYIAVHELYDRIFGVFEALMAAVTLLSLGHALAAVVAERRAEIAMLRVVGLRRRDVVAIFVAEGALLGALGAVAGGLGALGVAALVRQLGGIPMPPPPGFSVGYAAQIRLDALGFGIVLPVTLLAAVFGSVLPAWRATGGGLSRGLMGLGVVLLALAARPVEARAEEPATVLDRAVGVALPADQRCVVDVEIDAGTGTPAGWRLALHGADRLVVSTTLPAGRRQAVLERAGPDGGTWFQTESMANAMRVGLAQRLAGAMSIGDLVDPGLVRAWVPAPSTPATLTAGTVLATPRPGGDASFSRAEFDLAGGRLVAARFSGPSGALARSVAYRYTGDRLAEVDVTPRGSSATRVVIGALACAPGAWSVGPETLLGDALKLLEGT